jgi:hypothetical protein
VVKARERRKRRERTKEATVSTCGIALFARERRKRRERTKEATASTCGIARFAREVSTCGIRLFARSLSSSTPPPLSNLPRRYVGVAILTVFALSFVVAAVLYRGSGASAGNAAVVVDDAGDKRVEEEYLRKRMLALATGAVTARPIEI